MRTNRALLLLLPALLILSALILAGCKDFSFYGVLGDRIDDSPLQIAPAAATVAEGSTLDFTATGGKPAYSFVVASGPGYFSDADTFVASAAGTVQVQVTDSKGRTSFADVTITSIGATPLQIAPPSVSVLVGESVTFYVFGGTPTYTFTVLTNNSGAPPMTDENYTAGLTGGVTDTVRVQDSAASPPVTASVNVVTAPVADVDYWVPAPTINFPGTGSGGQTIPGGYDFTIENRGASPGAQPVSWWVFISENNTLGDGDALLSSGSTAALPAGGSTVPPIVLAGTWPAVGGNRWLFALVAAGDDLDSANNASSGSAVTLTPPNIDYVVTTVGSTGATLAGGPLTGSFFYRNDLASDGSQTVHWIAYVSTDNILTVGVDPVIDSGDAPALTGTTTSLTAVDFGGTWPAGAGDRYLFVAVSSGDDVNTGNNTNSSGAVAVGVVDYSGAVAHTGGTTAGAGFAGSLSISNISGAYARDGSQNLNWIVYASLGDAVASPDDKVVASGVDLGGLAAGGSLGPLVIGSTWPTAAGPYYLVVEVSAADDFLTGNNRFDSGLVTVNPPNVDYTALNVAFDPSAPSTTTPGAAVQGTFQYRNQGADAGVQSVYWSAYASRNTTLDASDAWIASGTAGPLAGLTTSPAPVAFSGSWPLDYGNYFLLVMVSEIQDVNAANDRVASAVSTPIGMYTGALAENNNEDNGDYTALVDVYSLGVTLKPGMSIYVEGTLNNSDDDDVLGFNTGTATSVTASMRWTGAQPMQLYIEKGEPVPTFLKGIGASFPPGVDALSIAWTVDLPNMQRWIDITNGPPAGNVGAYTLIITAN